MGVNVLTPVDRIAGFSGRTMGTGRGNFWIICTTSNDDGGTFTHSKILGGCQLSEDIGPFNPLVRPKGPFLDRFRL